MSTGDSSPDEDPEQAGGRPFDEHRESSGSADGDNADSLNQLNRRPAEFEDEPTEVDSSASDDHSRAASRSPSAGDNVGPYRLLSLLGQGGMGTVWRALQTEPVRREVAVKLIRSESVTAETAERFQAERRALAVMSHPGIAAIFDAGTTAEGQPWFAMELVSGQRLTAFCDQQSLSLRRRLELFADVCMAVHHAHQKGIIHRDLKPSNILVSLTDGSPLPKVIDFGLAKVLRTATDELVAGELTDAGEVLGTLRYMSPEQADAGLSDIDIRTDVYSLGVILYELLTGTVPLAERISRKHSLLELLGFIRSEDPVRPSLLVESSAESADSDSRRRLGTSSHQLSRDLSSDLDWVVMKALEKSRDRRYESVAAFARDIRCFLDSRPVTARPPSTVYRIRKFVRRNRTAVAAGGLAVTALIAGTVGTTWGMMSAQRSAEQTSEALRQSATRLELVEQGNDLLAGIFDDLDVLRIRENGDSVEAELGRRLGAAATRLQTAETEDPLMLARMQERLGTGLSSLGRYSQAEEILRTARQIMSRQLGADHIETMQVHNEELAAASESGDAEESIARLQEFHLRCCEIHGPNHPLSLSAQNNLAAVMFSSGQFAEAQTRFTAAGDGLARLPDPDLLMLLRCRHNAAACLIRLGRSREAEAALQEVVKLSAEILGDDHPDTLRARSARAAALMHSGHTAEAVRELRDLEQPMRLRLGERHDAVLTVIHNLAAGISESGDPAAAVPLLQEVLRLRTEMKGDSHVETVETQISLAGALALAGRGEEARSVLDTLPALSTNNQPPLTATGLRAAATLAAMMHRQGDSPAAIELLERVLPGAETSLGERHPSTLEMNSLLLTIRGAMSPDPDTISRMKEIAGMQAEVSGEGHPDTLQTRGNLAAMLLISGRTAEAAEAFEQVYPLMAEHLGENHSSTINAAVNLAELRRQTGDAAGAVEMLRTVYTSVESMLGPEHPQTLECLNNLGAALYSLGESEEAVGIFRRVVEGRRRDPGEGHPLTITSETNLAVVLRSVGKADEAIQLLRRTVSQSDRSLGPGHPETNAARITLAKTAQQAGRPLLALEVFREIMDEHVSRLGPIMLRPFR